MPLLGVYHYLKIKKQMEDPEITHVKARIRNLDTLIIHEKQIDYVIKKIDGLLDLFQKTEIVIMDSLYRDLVRLG